MFTGLVQAVGTVTETRRVEGGVVLHIRAPFRELVLGESIATDGTCLTVTRDSGEGFEAHASTETLAKTTLGGLTAGARVHLERALRADERLGGHIVTGHVDGVGMLAEKKRDGENLVVTFEAPPNLAPFLAPKGSITVDGVSLTVNGVRDARFDVMLVPFTQSETKLGQIPERGSVNLEVDILAKYVARLLGKKGVDGEGEEGVSLDLLARHGYL